MIEILGHKDDPGVDILPLFVSINCLRHSEEVIEEAEKAPDSISEEEIIGQGRRDLRAKTHCNH